MTILFTHPDCLSHNPGQGHPERPERLKAVLAALDHADFAALDRREAPQATQAQIARVHDADYVTELLAAVPTQGQMRLDADTAMSPGSGNAAQRAAGAAIAAVDAVMAGAASNAFCACGHRGTMPSRATQWDSVCSIRWRWARPMPRPSTGWSGSPSSISTFITATVRRP